MEFLGSHDTAGLTLLEDVTFTASFRSGDSVFTLEDIMRDNLAHGMGAEHPKILVLDTPVIPPEDLLRGSCALTLTFLLDIMDFPIFFDRAIRMFKRGKDIECAWLGQPNEFGVGLVLAREKNRETGVRFYRRIGLVYICQNKRWPQEVGFDEWEVKPFKIH